MHDCVCARRWQTRLSVCSALVVAGGTQKKRRGGRKKRVEQRDLRPEGIHQGGGEGSRRCAKRRRAGEGGRRGWRATRVEAPSEHQNYFPAGTPPAREPPRNFSPLISDGMIIRGDISHESGTWLNVDFIAAVRPGRRRGRDENFHGIAGKRDLREGTVGLRSC